MARLKKKSASSYEQVQLGCKLGSLKVVLAAADAEAGAPDLTPKWVQVAASGDYKGYAGGAFVFDDAVFAQLITNFRKHPSYQAVNGVGGADVIPWDFNHASASFAADGSIPITGTPAQGWICELKTEPLPAGGTGLFALTRWLEPARTYILEDKYKWASVVVGFDCRDQLTNQNIGAVLESVALTNNPFIAGMQKLVADNKGHMPGQPKAQARLEWYGRTASSPEDAFTCLRNLFGLPQTADIGVVLGELTKLQAWATSGGAPIGVDLDELVSAVRTIFNLPALSSTDEVFFETQKLLGALLEQQASEELETETPPAPAAASTEGQPAAGQLENRNMSIVKVIASRLGVQETEAAATQAVEGLFAFRASLAKLLTVPEHVSDKVLLDAAAGAGDARTKLGALLAALGIEDSGAAVEKIAGLMKQATELEAAMPELKSLREAAAAVDAKEGEEEVEKVMNSMGSADAGIKLALSTLRKGDKASFRTQFAAHLSKAPVALAAPAPGHAYLTTVISGGQGGSERVIAPQADGSVQLSAPGAGAKAGAPVGGKTRVDLSLRSGRNRTEKIHDHIRATVPGADKFTFDQMMNAGIELARTSELVGG